MRLVYKDKQTKRLVTALIVMLAICALGLLEELVCYMTR